MDARPALLGLIVLGGCPQPGEAEEGFHVSFSFPADGEEAFAETPVRLGFSDPIDSDTCGRPTWFLAALGLDGRIAWEVPFLVESMAEANTFELAHEGLTVGFDHVLTVQGGEEGCLSAAGDPVAPFSITFPVVERPEG